PSEPVDRFLRFARSRAFRRLSVFPDPSVVREGSALELVESARGVYEPGVVDGLLSAAASRSRPELAARAISVLAGLWRKPEPWDGKWWSIQPAKTPPPPHVVGWERSDAIRKVVLESLGPRQRIVRKAALDAIREMDDRSAAPRIRERW